MKKITLMFLAIVTSVLAYGQNNPCFTSGSKVTMGNKSVKNIETIKAGDKVLTYNQQTNTMEETEVVELIEVRKSNFMQLIIGGISLFIASDDQSFWTKDKGWAAISAKRANKNTKNDKPIVRLEIGDELFVPSRNAYASLRNALKIDGEYPGYTLKLKEGNTFILNGLLVKIDEIK